MKLNAEMNTFVQEFEAFIEKHGMDKLNRYIEDVRESKEYNNFEVRIIWDFIRFACDPFYLSDLYSKYDCNDSHIFTLGKKVFYKYFTI